MDVYEIQTIVLECLRAAGVPRVLKTTIYSLSDHPAEAAVARVVKQNMMVVKFVASFDEFMNFRECANLRGVWINARWQPFGQSERFTYNVSAVEKR
jgi:hypothetical protein